MATTSVSPEQLLEQRLCAGDRPLALLPVRLETRFFPRADGGSDLRVRIYPDKIHVDSHERELTPDERDWAQHYWLHEWRSGSDTRRRSDAWRQLVDRFGAARAAWLVRVQRPTNLAQRPTAPLPADAVPGIAPVFPAVSVVDDGRNAAWRRAPRALLLPQRWTAVLRSGGVAAIVAQGRDIRSPLAVGPNPKAAAAAVSLDRLAIDAGMKWMVDFATAEAIGMALTIPVPAATLAAGIDSLVVFGVAPTGAAQSAAAFAGLLDGHHYTDGLEFLRVGTPTNNTADRRSGYGGGDRDADRSLAAEVLADPASLASDTNAGQLGRALGLSATQSANALGRVGAAAQRHAGDQRTMNVALWPASWGYVLAERIGFDGTGLTPQRLAWAREHFVTHVRTFGPLAPLRCGRQPYGVLPVTSLDAWQPVPGQGATTEGEATLAALLRQLRERVWRPQLAQVARIGARQSPPDPDADLADVMRTDAIASGYRTRSVFGRHYLQHLRAFLGEDLQASGFVGAQDAQAAATLRTFGFDWRAPLSTATYAEDSWSVAAPLVQRGEVSPWAPLAPNEIGALAALTSVAAIVAWQPATPSLLGALLRHALLRELAHAAATIAATLPDASLAALLHDAELVDLVTGAPPTLTWRRQLALKMPALTGERTIGEHLDAALRGEALPATATLLAGVTDCRTSLRRLARLDSEALQLLLQGTLDLASHRLDAWITSLATRRLATLRAGAPTGLYVGAYGWVENLRPQPVAPEQMSPLPGEPGPIFAAPHDSGFVHAPSADHAAVAALLRNAHLGATGLPGADSPFAIDLSSRRVREAQRLIDGVRQGQPLGALLGYRIERSLHEASLDHFVAPLRELAPLAARRLEATSLSVEQIAANNVVDGLALHAIRRDTPERITVALQAVGATPRQLADAQRELDALGAAIDGLADTLTAEAAYQIVRGNTDRTAATIAAVAGGDVPVPEPEVTHLPRSGIALTHRVLLLWNGPAAPVPGWTGRASARSLAEPVLDAWVARLFGDPRKVRFVVEQLDPRSGSVTRAVALRLSELKLGALDLVYGVDPRSANTPGAAAPSEVEQRALYVAQNKSGGLGADAPVRIRAARPTDLAPGESTLADWLDQARTVRRLLAFARGADATDLSPPERGVVDTIDSAELEARAAKAETALRTAHDTLRRLVQRGAASPAASLRTGLLRLAGYGLAASIPASAAGDGDAARAALLAQAAAVLRESRQRLDRGAALRALPALAEARGRRDQLVERMRAVFGPGFVVLPRFACDAEAGAEFARALAASVATQGADPFAAHTWLLRHARVREPVARLNACLRSAEVMAAGERLAPGVAQLPFAAGERWAALAADAGQVPPAGKLSLVVQATAAVDPAAPLAGLIVDEWTETIPSRDETTAIAFQCDPPDACAPQTVLLAVPPVPGADWTLATLHRVLTETLDLAKLRAVDGESPGSAGQYLPALHFAFNAKDDAVSTDFAPLI